MLYLMDGEHLLSVDTATLHEMRCWLTDCGECSSGTPIEVVRMVARKYPGGLAAFVEDVSALPERVLPASGADPHNDPSSLLDGGAS